jgi:SAM-dependent methyltransferase
VNDMVGMLRGKGEIKTPTAGAEYVDVLGRVDPIGPHRGQQAFRKKFLPVVYERAWRPLVSRVLLGPRGPGAAKERAITMEMLEISAGDRLIDVGCGTGNYTRWLAKATGGGLTVGVDASEVMIAAAAERETAGNAAYLRADACALPFEDGSFDVACSVGVVHMIERPMAAIDEMVRLLAPGGRLVIVVSCRRPGKPPRELGGVTFFGHDDVTHALRERGLCDVRQRVVHRGQFVAGRKPAEGTVGR